MIKPFLFILSVMFFWGNTKAQIFKEYTSASYYNLSGQKITGLIHLNIYEDHLLFRAEKDGKKEKIDVQDIKSVLINIDSIPVKTFLDGSKEKYYFSKLVLKGPVKIFYKFKHFSKTSAPSLKYGVSPNMNATGSQPSYSTTMTWSGGGAVFDETKSEAMYEDVSTTIPVTKKNFKEIMLKVFARRPEVVSDIQNEKYKFKDMDKIVNQYSYQTL